MHHDDTLRSGLAGNDASPQLGCHVAHLLQLCKRAPLQSACMQHMTTTKAGGGGLVRGKHQ
jgi:hypothetical protein